MQIKAISATILALSLIGLPAQAAPFKGEAKLAKPVADGRVVTVVGANWRCDGDTCIGEGKRNGGLDSLMKECRKVAVELGPLTEYRSRGRALSPANIAVCNKLAAKHVENVAVAEAK